MITPRRGLPACIDRRIRFIHVCALGLNHAHRSGFLRSKRTAEIAYTGKPALRIRVPNLLARLASHVCDLLHFSPFSFGHWALLQKDNVPGINRLPELLGRVPRSIGYATDLPHYSASPASLNQSRFVERGSVESCPHKPPATRQSETSGQSRTPPQSASESQTHLPADTGFHRCRPKT